MYLWYVWPTNETIYFEYGSLSASGRWCKFVVNEQLCSKCSYGLCNDNSIAHVIDCSNALLDEQLIQSVTTYNGCQADPSNLGVFDAIYVYENNLDTCSLELGGLEDWKGWHRPSLSNQRLFHGIAKPPCLISVYIYIYIYMGLKIYFEILEARIKSGSKIYVTWTMLNSSSFSFVLQSR